jgi:hypothetical protein
MTFFKKYIFFGNLFFYVHMLHSVTFEKLVTVENVFHVADLFADTGVINGTIFISPTILTLGNESQETMWYCYGLKNKDTGSYLVLDQDNKLSIFFKESVFRNADSYPQIGTDLINSNNADHSLSICADSGDLSFGSVYEKDINFIGKKLSINGSIKTQNTEGIFCDAKISCLGGLTIHGNLFLNTQNFTVTDHIDINTFYIDNPTFNGENVVFGAPVSFSQINVNAADYLTAKRLFFDGPLSSVSSIPSLLLIVDQANKINIVSASPNIFVGLVSNNGNDLSIQANTVFNISNNLFIKKNLMFQSNQSKISCAGDGSLTFTESVSFQSLNESQDDMIGISTLYANGPIKVEDLIIDAQGDLLVINPDIYVNGSVIFKNLDVGQGVALVVNTDPRYGYGRLMKPAGSSKRYKENIEDFTMSKKDFLDMITVFMAKEEEKNIFFINHEKLKGTFLENVFQESEGQIVFNNKELLALLLTQIPHLFQEIDSLEDTISDLCNV